MSVAEDGIEPAIRNSVEERGKRVEFVQSLLLCLLSVDRRTESEPGAVVASFRSGCYSSSKLRDA